tara:strand:- start:50 stop:346 length:297 start_codon:yes stop_codon:yes gene_type:complete
MLELFQDAELWPVLGPLGALLILIAAGEAFISRQRRAGGTRWAKRPISVSRPADKDVQEHEKTVEEIHEEARNAGEHQPVVPPEDVTDEEIDTWARGG